MYKYKASAEYEKKQWYEVAAELTVENVPRQLLLRKIAVRMGMALLGSRSITCLYLFFF